jgi:AP-1 complex subunit mu
MSASALFVMDLKGKIIISRNYRGDVPMSAAEKFTQHLNEDEETVLTPVITDEGYTFVYIRHNNLYLMAVTQRNSNAMLILSFLYRAVEVFEEYFTELNEESLRDNFVISYELLDEMMDFGYPQSTEAKVLKEFIFVEERHKFVAPTSVPDTVTSAVSWRNPNIVHKKNEIFLDVVEKLNLLVASNGTVLRSEILGALKMKSFLSGMPELKLGLNDKLLMDARTRQVAGQPPGQQTGKGVEMEDIRFHQCVRLARFENDRTISFVPPDGDFDLMVYRLNTQVRPLIWIEARVEKHSHSRIEYTIKAKSQYKRRSTANNVEITIPVPQDADSPTFKSTIGKVEYVPEKACIVWKIKQFQGQKEYMMHAHFGLPSIQAEEASQNKAPISVKFEIPYFTVSGIQVRYLKIMEKSGYQALPWVRYITQNGDYQIRMS